MSTLLAEPKLIDGCFQEMKNRGWHDFSDRAPAAEDFHIPQQGISQYRLHCLESTSFVAHSKLF